MIKNDPWAIGPVPLVSVTGLTLSLLVVNKDDPHPAAIDATEFIERIARRVVELMKESSGT